MMNNKIHLKLYLVFGTRYNNILYILENKMQKTIFN